eukprot:1405848-Prorocentrum_lima.AAC.1
MLVDCLKPTNVHSFKDLTTVMNADISERAMEGMQLHPLLWFINNAQAGFFRDWPGMEALGATAFTPPSDGLNEIIGITSKEPQKFSDNPET